MALRYFHHPKHAMVKNISSSNKQTAEKFYTPATSTDFWALGVTLYGLLHGRYPFEDEGPMKLSEMIMNDEPCISDSLSPETIDLLAELMNKSAEDRIDETGIRNHAWVGLNGPIQSRDENTRARHFSDEVKITKQATKRVCF